jgi:serine protease Do
MIERVRPSVVQVHSEGRGGGAGVIWRSDGAIVTNNHVVEHAGGTIQVVLTDGRSLEAKVVKTARSLDLALLQVEAQDLPAAPVADSSNLRVGELVFAVGHPWGQEHVVTAGIVAAHGTVDPPGSGRSAHYVRTDARLAPGNSGGPLVDAHGAVVGINAMIFGGDQGVAIPSHVVASWLAAEPSRRVYLGVEVRPIELPPSPRDERRRPRAAGLLVGTVHADGPANRAGLLAGDVLLEVDGEVTQRSVLDALEARYPMLCGTIRDHDTQQRRGFVRFFACEQDLSHDSLDSPLPEAVAKGVEPFFVIGAIAGG